MDGEGPARCAVSGLRVAWSCVASVVDIGALAERPEVALCFGRALYTPCDHRFAVGGRAPCRQRPVLLPRDNKEGMGFGRVFSLAGMFVVTLPRHV